MLFILNALLILARHNSGISVAPHLERNMRVSFLRMLAFYELEIVESSPLVISSVLCLIARQAQAVIAENHLQLSLSAQLLFCGRHHVARIEAEPLLQLFEGC
jgi:hypothetical protein